jgi:hypothetical protein
LLSLLWYLFDHQPQTFARVGAPMVGIFPLIMMFLITSIAMLRERTTGTLERLMSMPLAKLDLLFGYGLAFAFSPPCRPRSPQPSPSAPSTLRATGPPGAWSR